MNSIDYKQKRDNLVNDFLLSMDFKKDEMLTAKYHIVSASLSNYLPEIDCKNHETIFRNILLHQQLSHLEQASYDALQCMSYENLSDNLLGILKNKPSIICTFHTGSYRLINLFLAKNKIPYSLVIANSVIKTQGDLFNELYKDVTNNKGEVDFETINAEHPSSGLQMLKNLKKERSLLLYMDGNTGAGSGTLKSDNHCKINFLNQALFARKGIAFLAHVAQVPILPVACYRKSLEDIRLRFFEPIYPNANEAREIFAAQSTQAIYDLFAPIIQQYPEQWEAWLYLHKSAHIINGFQRTEQLPFDRDSKLLLNTSLYSVFSIAGKAFLFNKNTYLSYPIDSSVYVFLSGCSLQSARLEGFDIALLQQLYNNHVLKAA